MIEKISVNDGITHTLFLLLNFGLAHQWLNHCPKSTIEEVMIQYVIIYDTSDKSKIHKIIYAESNQNANEQ